MTLEKLLPATLRKALPPLGATGAERDPQVQVKFFYPDCSWTWYAIEFDGQDTFFGLVDGFEKELSWAPSASRSCGRTGASWAWRLNATSTSRPVRCPRCCRGGANGWRRTPRNTP